MNDPLLVCSVQRAGKRDRDLHEHRGVQMASIEALPQGLTLEQLHDDELSAIRRLADVVNRADVRMAERGDCPRFPLEALQGLGVGGQRLREDLQGDGPVKSCIVGTIDLAHAAAADRRADLVRTEANTRGQHERAGSELAEIIRDDECPVGRRQSRLRVGAWVA